MPAVLLDPEGPLNMPVGPRGPELVAQSGIGVQDLLNFEFRPKNTKNSMYSTQNTYFKRAWPYIKVVSHPPDSGIK